MAKKTYFLFTSIIFLLSLTTECFSINEQDAIVTKVFTPGIILERMKAADAAMAKGFTATGTGEEQTRFNWGVRALPWLIFTDEEHIVTDEGFLIAEIEEKIK
ncbi:MAG: hypothetical protein JXA96_13950 [Sedimentisphaerales bacterium]|nr:hypothetical protein [Sedimentisphaerales bacterium]